MASVRARLEEISTDDDDESSSMAPYNTFNSMPTEDSLEHLRRRNADINGDPAHYQCTDSGVEEKSAWAKVFRSRCFKCVDITATVVVIFLIWMVMALPTGFYAFTVLGINSQDSPPAINSTCTLYNATTNVCIPYLYDFTRCLRLNSSSDDTDVYISGPLNEDALNKASRDIWYLRLFGPTLVGLREQCQLSIEPLICLHNVHICDGESDIGPSIDQCNHIEDVCDHELEKLQSRPFVPVNDYLSNCTHSSPLDDKECDPTFNRIDQSVGSQNVTCNSGYYRTTNGTCLPECNVWSPYSNTTVLATDIIAISSAVVALVFGIAVLLLSCVHCQKMYRYPTIFIIYQTIPVLVQAVVFLVGYGARRQLFCQSRDWIESITNPSHFCIITGAIFYYVVMQLLLWWLWHTVAVFWAVAWPFHARKFNTSRNTKYLHIVFTLASLLLPVAPVLIILFVQTTSGDLEIEGGFTITRSPPFACAGHDIHVNFWAYIFPLSLVLAIGVTLLVFILRIVIKHHFLSKIHKIRVNLNWDLELKVLIVLCYYVFLGAAVLTFFTMALTSIPKFYDKLIALVQCESGLSSNLTESSCNEEQEQLRSIVQPYPTTIGLLVLGLLPTVNFIYTLKIKELISKLKCFQKRQVHYIRRESSRSTQYVPYKVHQEPISTTLQHGSLIVHTRNANTEPMFSSSQANNDLRQ